MAAFEYADAAGVIVERVHTVDGSPEDARLAAAAARWAPGVEGWRRVGQAAPEPTSPPEPAELAAEQQPEQPPPAEPRRRRGQPGVRDPG